MSEVVSLSDLMLCTGRTIRLGILRIPQGIHHEVKRGLPFIVEPMERKDP
jgi:hypothetical protein